MILCITNNKAPSSKLFLQTCERVDRRNPLHLFLVFTGPNQATQVGPSENDGTAPAPVGWDGESTVPTPRAAAGLVFQGQSQGRGQLQTKGGGGTGTGRGN